MNLRGALDHASLGGLSLRFAPPRPRSSRIAHFLVERYGDGDRPQKSPEELEALLERLRAACFDWTKVGAADRLDVAWVLWDGPEPPAEHEAFLHAFLRWVETPWRRVQARRVAAAWAAAFDPGLESIRFVGAWLAERASRRLDPWSALAEEFDIFSIEHGPGNLAKAFLAADETAEEFFSRLRFPARAAAGGFVLAALGAAAEFVETRLAKEPSLAARLAELSIHEGVFRPNAAAATNAHHAQSVRAKLADALLLPWRSEEPPSALKEHIIVYLLCHYDDARIKRENWAGVKPQAVKTFCHWLNVEAVVAFFRIAEQAKAEHALRWRERKKFWLSYIDHIDDAWLIAGSQSSALVKGENRGYGRLVGCRPHHAALLLKIKGMTIVETSDGEHERVWLAGNEQAPPRYHGGRQSYSAAALTTGADFSSGYSRDDAGAWQRRLGAFIERHTGIVTTTEIRGAR